MKRLDGLEPATPPLPVAAHEVDAAEAALTVTFPSGYREFITRYGRGVLGGPVRIYTPDDMLHGANNVREWRQRIDEYWFWDKTEALFPKAHALECIVIGDTVGGDELVFHPAQPSRLYVLSHDFDEAYLASESGLDAAVDWFFTSGVLDKPFEDKSFEPY